MLFSIIVNTWAICLNPVVVESSAAGSSFTFVLLWLEAMSEISVVVDSRSGCSGSQQTSGGSDSNFSLQKLAGIFGMASSTSCVRGSRRLISKSDLALASPMPGTERNRLSLAVATLTGGPAPLISLEAITSTANMPPKIQKMQKEQEHQYSEF
jgi:hypothetical protein